MRRPRRRLKPDLESAKRLAQDLWREFRDLVRIQRLTARAGSAGARQVFFLRENLAAPAQCPAGTAVA